MQAGDGSDQAQPETVSRRVAALFQPIEALENMLAFFGGIPGPSSAIETTGLPSMVSFATTTCPPGAAMLDRVVDEIGDGIKDQVAIAGHQHLAIAGDGEMGAVLLGRGIVQLDNLAGDFDQVHGAERALALPGSRFARSA